MEDDFFVGFQLLDDGENRTVAAEAMLALVSDIRITLDTHDD